ncbi:Alpha-ketoglutarate-dependent 2,4-dichlorophenoxyacetate dioxygenase [Paraconexibacter sp. AEG42_29]|uniref:Alpha-ketoglutarate-dependent 2,4-dichlorophenoxyacetate dioxygenase n=1 Tax=Paraconexibacter sp. AEG42_29 TaxID=2997339 RepID=A0AAU7B1Z9_9ACTN
MEHVTHDPLGVTVDDLRTGDLDADGVARLRALLAEHGVLVLRRQHLDDAAFVAFLRAFGPLTFTTGEAAADGFPDLNVVSNVGRTTPPRSTWHVDTSYVARPPAYTALRAVLLPAHGGETLFTSQYRAADSLPADLRALVDGRTIRHVVTGVQLGEGDESAAEHPILRPHPLTGQPALYLTTPARCAAVSGLPQDEADALVASLFAHSTREDNVFRHAWAPGDVVMWDNACVLHRADHSGVVGDRVMHRGMVADHVPTGAVS